MGFGIIENPYPSSWRELQSGVCRLFREIGLSADVEVVIETPRGTVSVDVYATDENSIDKIKYIVECKNWNNSVPQSVAHSFTTVMSEIGANIGFIVCKVGLQPGASRYIRNTNIVGLTYLELQERYVETWWRKFFCPHVAQRADRVLPYVEPYLLKRDNPLLEQLSREEQADFRELCERYAAFVQAAWLLDIQHFFPDQEKSALSHALTYLGELKASSGQDVYLRDVLQSVLDELKVIEEKFSRLCNRDSASAQ